MWRKWRLLARAIVSLAIAVVATRLFPYNTWRRWSQRTGGTTAQAETRSTPTVPAQEIVRAINAASTVVPFGGNCLARALAGRAMFVRFGLPADVTFGVARGPAGEFLAHAWLRHDGRFVLGEQGVEGFVPMPDLSERNHR